MELDGMDYSIRALLVRIVRKSSCSTGEIKSVSQQILVMMNCIGAIQEMKRSLYLLKRAAESVVNALNLNAGVVVVVVAVVVVRMVAAKNENKNKNQKHFFIQTGQTGVAFTIID